MNKTLSKHRSMSGIIRFEHWRNRFWPVSTLAVLVCVGLLAAALQVPNLETDNRLAGIFLRGYSSEGARLILASIATALMTVVGVLFSVTVVVLQQVSSQYSPRVIETFIKSYNSQLMLGLYIGTFVYCVLLLRQIPPGSGTSKLQMPEAAVSAAIILALLCVALLVHYIHHIADSIKSSRIIESLREETLTHLTGFTSYRERNAEPNNTYDSVRMKYRVAVRARATGYFQSFNPEKLDRTLRSAPAVARLISRPGDFVHRGFVLAEVKGEAEDLPILADRLAKAFEIGAERTHAQDFRFGIRQLADIGVRALSPGINDPSTTIEALNSIGVIVGHYGRCCHFAPRIRLSSGARVELRHVTYDEILELAFSQIISLSAAHVPVLIKAREIIASVTATENDKARISANQRMLKLCQDKIDLAADAALFAGSVERA